MLYFGVGDYVHIRLLHGRPLNTHYNARKKLKKKNGKKRKRKVKYIFFQLKVLQKSPN